MLLQRDLATEFYGLPEYVIDQHETERTACGVRIYHWRSLGGVYVPLFTAVLAPVVLAQISQEAHAAALRAMREPIKSLEVRMSLKLSH